MDLPAPPDMLGRCLLVATCSYGVVRIKRWRCEALFAPTPCLQDSIFAAGICAVRCGGPRLIVGSLRALGAGIGSPGTVEVGSRPMRAKNTYSVLRVGVGGAGGRRNCRYPFEGSREGCQLAGHPAKMFKLR